MKKNVFGNHLITPTTRYKIVCLSIYLYLSVVVRLLSQYLLQDEGGDDIIENPEEVLQECLEKFKTPDYIMEPGIFGQLKRYFQAGGNPEQVIEQLSINYSAVAQMANLLAEWLILGGNYQNDYYH